MESFVQAQDQNFLSNTEKIQRELEDEGLSKMLKTNFNLPNCLYWTMHGLESYIFRLYSKDVMISLTMKSACILRAHFQLLNCVLAKHPRCTNSVCNAP